MEGTQGFPGLSLESPEASNPEQKSSMIREESETDSPDAKLLDKWATRIKGAKKKHEKVFKRMRQDMDFAWGKQWPDDDENLSGDKYVANIIQQHIRQKTAALYAKNPKFVVKRRDRMYFQFWDEKPETLQEMQQRVMMNPSDPVARQMAMDLMKDFEEGSAAKERVDKVAETLEILFQSEIDGQTPNFKKQMKQAVRRALTVGVAYAKVGFQRKMKPRPDVEAQIQDATQRIAHIEKLIADQQDGLNDDQSAEMAELKNSLKSLQEEEQVILREGLVYSFPKSTSIIPDEKTQSLEGFLGAEWVAEEFILSTDDIKEIYKVDIGKNYTAYSEKSDAESGKASSTSLFANSDERFADSKYGVVWEVYDKKSGTVFTICEGYKNYLRKPAAPDIKLEDFFPYSVLMFNEVEHEDYIFPLSDCRLLRHIQKEYNRAKESLRQHRIASSPLYAAAGGIFDEEDQKNLAGHQPHDVVVVKGLGENENINNKLQQVKKHPIDPNVYETQSLFGDMTRVIGTQEANLGSVSKATATETSIAEDSRQSSLASDADEVDGFLSDMAKKGGQVVLRNFSTEQVIKKCGRGAVWPELSMQDIYEECYIDIEAGSSGRPNKASKAAALERTGQILMSLPGVNPRWLFKQMMSTVDENMDLSEAYAEGQPSILMMNRLAATAQAVPSGVMDDPRMQGGQGFDNQTNLPQGSAGPQPKFPAPGEEGF